LKDTGNGDYNKGVGKPENEEPETIKISLFGLE